jgi:hypothetical protein
LVCIHGEEAAEDEEIDTAQAGIHILKRSDLVEESLFDGNFKCMACFENYEYAVASDETQGINIFSIEDGRLSTQSFFCHSVSWPEVVGICIIGSYLGLHFPPQASCTY